MEDKIEDILRSHITLKGDDRDKFLEELIERQKRMNQEEVDFYVAEKVFKKLKE